MGKGQAAVYRQGYLPLAGRYAEQREVSGDDAAEDLAEPQIGQRVHRTCRERQDDDETVAVPDRRPQHVMRGPGAALACCLDDGAALFPGAARDRFLGSSATRRLPARARANQRHRTGYREVKGDQAVVASIYC